MPLINTGELTAAFVHLWSSTEYWGGPRPQQLCIIIADSGSIDCD